MAFHLCVFVFVRSSLDEITEKKKIKGIWDPESHFILTPISTPSPASGFSLRRKKCVFDDPLDFLNMNELSTWNLFDLTTAAKLLRKPPIACNFSDEHEMRRVYSMIYDVYRCRSNLFKIKSRVHKQSWVEVKNACHKCVWAVTRTFTLTIRSTHIENDMSESIEQYAIEAKKVMNHKSFIIQNRTTSNCNPFEGAGICRRIYSPFINNSRLAQNTTQSSI